MATYKIKLRSRNEVASGTMAFHFEKPDGFAFQPGQCGDFTLLNPPQTDAEGNTRSFSLASAPYEDELTITTRLRDTAFKRSLKMIDLGTELTLEAPWGELTLHTDPQIPAVFLTGGIGVTPVRSIVLQATHDKLAHSLFLFYSNRTRNDAVFLDELTAAQEANPNFTLIATMTEWRTPTRSGMEKLATSQKLCSKNTFPISAVPSTTSQGHPRWSPQCRSFSKARA